MQCCSEEEWSRGNNVAFVAISALPGQVNNNNNYFYNNYFVKNLQGHSSIFYAVTPTNEGGEVKQIHIYAVILCLIVVHFKHISLLVTCSGMAGTYVWRGKLYAHYRTYTVPFTRLHYAMNAIKLFNLNSWS